MRRTILLPGLATWTLMLAACKPSAAPAGPTTAGRDRVAVVTAQPAPIPACMGSIDDTSSVAPTRLQLDARSVHLCAGSHEPDDKKPQCFVIDRASGTYSVWTPPPGVVAAPSPAAGAKLRVEGNAITVLDSAGHQRGTIRPRGFDEQSPVAINEAGTYVVVTISGEPSVVEVYEVATGKRTARIPLADTGCGDGTFVGDTVLVVEDVCAGPQGEGTLYTTRGKKLARLGGSDEDLLNAYGPELVHLEGSQWAFGLSMSNVVLFVDVSTGKELKRIKLDALDGEVTENGPTTYVVHELGGKLLVATGAASVAVIDIATAALESAWTARPCTEEAAP